MEFFIGWEKEVLALTRLELLKCLFWEEVWLELMGLFLTQIVWQDFYW